MKTQLSQAAILSQPKIVVRNRNHEDKTFPPGKTDFKTKAKPHYDEAWIKARPPIKSVHPRLVKNVRQM